MYICNICKGNAFGNFVIPVTKTLSLYLEDLRHLSNLAKT